MKSTREDDKESNREAGGGGGREMQATVVGDALREAIGWRVKRSTSGVGRRQRHEGVNGRYNAHGKDEWGSACCKSGSERAVTGDWVMRK